MFQMAELQVTQGPKKANNYRLHETSFIIRFPYNARSDWLKQRVLSVNKARVDDGKFKFLLRNFDKFDPKKGGKDLTSSRALHFFRASCVLYNRTEHSRGFLTC